MAGVKVGVFFRNPGYSRQNHLYLEVADKIKDGAVLHDYVFLCLENNHYRTVALGPGSTLELEVAYDCTVAEDVCQYI